MVDAVDGLDFASLSMLADDLTLRVMMAKLYALVSCDEEGGRRELTACKAMLLGLFQLMHAPRPPPLRPLPRSSRGAQSLRTASSFPRSAHVLTFLSQTEETPGGAAHVLALLCFSDDAPAAIAAERFVCALAEVARDGVVYNDRLRLNSE